MKQHRFVLPLVLLLLLLRKSYAQEQYWPVEFGNPDSSDKIVVPVSDTSDATGSTDVVAAEEEETLDSSQVLLSTKTTYFQTLKAHSRLDWLRQFTNAQLEQTASYQYNQLSPHSSIQTVDGSGNVMFESVWDSPFDAGLLWTPIVSYNKRTDGTLQSSVDMGPVLSGAMLGLPFTVKAGLYGYVWNDSIVSGLFSNSDGRYHASPGVFGGIDCGSEEVPLQFAPVYASLSATGRSIDGNNLGLMRVGALYADETGFLGGGDSLYLSFNDSITNGKEIYIGEFSGRSFLSNTSWRINHSFSAITGLRFRERLYTVFRSYYRYNYNSISYRDMASSSAMKLSGAGSGIDTRTTAHLFGLSARTREGLPLVYRGGIEFGREFEDKFYKLDFGDNDYPSEAVREVYIINQNDHYTDNVRTDHELFLTLPGGFGVQYHLSFAKESRLYPFVFRETLTKTRKNENESDRVRRDHLLSFKYDRDSTVNCDFYGKYGRMYYYYYHENRTAESRITDEYRVGCNVRFSIGPVSVREHIYMDAEISDYYFKKIGEKLIDAPPYSRDFSSSLSGEWRIRDNLSLNGTWLSLYRDDGYWYGKEYRSDTITGPEYYAIERKGTQYWVDLWFNWLVREQTTISIGSKFRDIFERRYDFQAGDGGDYVISDLDIGYGIEPYIKAVVESDAYGGSVSVRRIFNTEDTQRWSKKKNWDISLSFQVYW